MEVHTGELNPRTASKTEILFCPKPLFLYRDPDSYDDTDLSDIIIDDHHYIPIVDFFPYLGSVISSDTSDTKDVTLRIKKASNAFGALRKCIFASTNVKLELKALIYTSVILPILLYGCECWCLTESLNRKLRNFHNQCVRAMCRVNLRHTFLHGIFTKELLNRLSLEPIDTYICKQQLCWAGHVARMPWSAYPEKCCLVGYPPNALEVAPNFLMVAL